MNGQWYFLLPSESSVWADLYARVLYPLLVAHAEESDEQLVFSAFAQGMWAGLAVSDAEKSAVLGPNFATMPVGVNVLRLLESMVRSFQAQRQPH